MPEDSLPEQSEFLFEEVSTPPAATSSMKRRFIGWEQSILAALVDEFTSRWNGAGVLDLSDTLVIVPSKNAGRRLREGLAIRAAEEGAAVFPPLVVTPNFLYSAERLPGLTEPVATTAQTQWIWTALFLRISLPDFRRLFPVDPVDRSLKWACQSASDFLTVRRLLSESGHNFASAGETLAREDMEPLRWEEMARLEGLAVTEAKRCGLLDETTAQLSVPEEGILPDGINRIALCGVADLPVLAAKSLTHYANSCEVEVFIAAPESHAAHFDEHGHPVPKFWMEEPIPIYTPATTIHDAVTPLDQAEKAAELLSHLDHPAAKAAIGIPDAALSIPLQKIFAERGIESYDPAGKLISTEGIYYLLKQTTEIISADSLAAFRRLLNCPGIPEAISRTLPGGTDSSPVKMINLTDDLIIDTLPASLSDAKDSAKRRFSKKHPELALAIEWMQDWAQRFRREPFEKTLAAWLTEIYEGPRFDRQDLQQQILTEVASAINTLERDLEAVRDAFEKTPTGPEKLELLLTSLSGQAVYPERTPEQMDLQGWLELLWEDAPHLVITGMNDHVVPEAVAGHAFLPDTARRVLGVLNNDDRFSRDAYFLTAIFENRKHDDRQVDLIFGRESVSGDPLRPSRLLFQCPAAELPERTLQLFKNLEAQTPTAPRSIAFPLTPAPLPEESRVFQRLSPTAIKQYLACPFRFYLRYGLGMERVEIDKREMNAADFGNLVHDSLEKFAQDEEAANSTDPNFIKNFLHEEIDRQLSFQYGNELATPLVIQRESARKRLGWWAEVEATQRLEGWKIEEPEATFGTDEWPFEIADVLIRGRIDRIESHPADGIRVIDFKTFSPGSGRSRKTVDTYHLKPLKRNESPDDFPDWILVEDDEGKMHRWTDLQLPLYLLAMQERKAGEPLTAAYATLGKAESEIALDAWTELDERLLAAARTCAVGVVESIRDHRFWPPHQDAPPWDDCGDLLGQKPDESIDPTGLGVGPNPVQSA
ncbi:MAG: PD-(D/E)XK nuclease family protein [Verrucomicrobiales bacterium]|nr:PD-(D/E)XK nuclease family protein [Verrucomicrobiales bacterium]